MFARATVSALATLLISARTPAGPLTPPAGPVSPTHKTLTEMEPRTPISSLPFTISQPGSYYLTADLTGVSGQAGITVAADNVTIDLRGYTLRGVAGSTGGIIANFMFANVALRDGFVRGWGGTGVAMGADNVQIEGIVSTNNGGTGISAGP